MRSDNCNIQYVPQKSAIFRWSFVGLHRMKCNIKMGLDLNPCVLKPIHPCVRVPRYVPRLWPTTNTKFSNAKHADIHLVYGLYVRDARQPFHNTAEPQAQQYLPTVAVGDTRSHHKHRAACRVTDNMLITMTWYCQGPGAVQNRVVTRQMHTPWRQVWWILHKEDLYLYHNPLVRDAQNTWIIQPCCWIVEQRQLVKHILTRHTGRWFDPN